MKFIALGHYSRVGKDTFANYLLEELARIAPNLICRKVALASKLKSIAHSLYQWDGMRDEAFYDTPEGAPLRDIKLPTIGKTPVELWVDLGCAVREHVHPTTWLDYVTKGDHDCHVVIVPDVRFPNEFEAFYAKEATTIQVVRPKYGPRPNRADRALLSESRWDYVIGGTGDKGELHQWATQFARHIKFGCSLETMPTQSQDERRWQLDQQKVEPWIPTLAV